MLIEILANVQNRNTCLLLVQLQWHCGNSTHLSIALVTELRQVLIASGKPMYADRIGWAVSFLFHNGALERARRGHYVIADAGRKLISQFPNGARKGDILALDQDPQSPISPSEKSDLKTHKILEGLEEDALTPVEPIESGVSRIREEVASELLSKLQGKEPGFFEQAVVKLLLAMGYGGIGFRLVDIFAVSRPADARPLLQRATDWARGSDEREASLFGTRRTTRADACRRPRARA